MADVVVNIRSKGFKQLEAGANRSAKALDKAGQQATKAGTAAKKSGTSFTKFGKAMVGAAVGVVGVGVALLAIRAGFRALTGFIGDAVKASSDFEAAMTKSIAIMDTTVDQQMRMADAAREVAKTTTFSAKESAEAFFFLASAGLDAEASITALPAVSKFAQAGMFDLALATDLLTDAQSALGLTIRDDAVKNLENMIRVSDVLVGANTLANASVEQFATALTTKAGAAMKAFGIEVEEGVAVLAALADQGVKGQLAGTAFATALTQLTTTAVKNKEAFQKLGIEVFDAQEKFTGFAKIMGDLEKAFKGQTDETKKNILIQLGFSDRTQATLLALQGTSQAIKDYEKALKDMGGITELVAEKQLKSFDARVKLLKDNFELFLIAMGNFVTLSPAIGEVLNALVNGVIDLTNSLIDNREKWIELTGKGINLTLGALDAFLTAGGLVVAGLGKLGQAFAFNQLQTLGLASAMLSVLEIMAKVNPVLGLFTGAMRPMIDSSIESAKTAFLLSADVAAMGESMLGAAAEIDILQEKVKFATEEELKNVAAAKEQAKKHLDVAKAFQGVQDALDGLGEGLGTVTGETEKLTTAQDKLLESLQADTIAAAQKELDDLASVFETGKIKAEQLSDEGLVKVVKSAQDLVAAGGQARPIIAALIAEFEKAEKVRDFAKALDDMTEKLRTASGFVGREAADALIIFSTAAERTIAETGELSDAFKTQLQAEAKALKEQFPGLTLAVDRFLGRIGAAPSQIEEVRDSMDELGGTTVSLGEFLGKVTSTVGAFGNVLAIFGVDVDSVIGKITRFISAIESLFGSLNSILGIFKGGGDGGGLLGGLGNLFGGLFGGGKGTIPGIPAGGIPGIAGIGATSGTTAGTGFLATFGAKVGGGFSSLAGTLAPLFTNPFTIAIGAGLAAFFVLKNIFGGPSNFEKVGNEIGEQLGISIGEGVQFGIVNLFEERGGTIGQAISLSMGEIIKDAIASGTADFDVLTEKVGDILSGLGRDEFTAEEATKALQESLAQLLPVLDELGVKGEQEMLRIITASLQAGLQFAELDELMRQFGITGVEQALNVRGAFEQFGGTFDEFRLAFPQFFDDIVAGSKQVQGAFDALGGNVNKLADHMASAATKTGRAWERVGRIISRINAGKDLNPTQQRFAGRVGLPAPDVQAQGGFFSPKLPRDMLIQAHAGERVNIGSPGGGVRRGGGTTVQFNVPVTIEMPGSIITGNAQEIAEQLAIPVTDVLEKNIGARIQSIVQQIAKEG